MSRKIGNTVSPAWRSIKPLAHKWIGGIHPLYVDGFPTGGRGKPDSGPYRHPAAFAS